MYEAAGVACDNREFPRVPDSCNNTVCLLPGEDKQGNVFYHGLSVCDDDWGWTQAQIICKERGYKTGIPTKESKFGPVPRNFVKILCQGGETRLEDCAKTRTLMPHLTLTTNLSLTSMATFLCTENNLPASFMMPLLNNGK